MDHSETIMERQSVNTFQDNPNQGRETYSKREVSRGKVCTLCNELLLKCGDTDKAANMSMEG